MAEYGKFKNKNGQHSSPYFWYIKLSFHLLKKDLDFSFFSEQFNVNFLKNKIVSYFKNPLCASRSGRCYKSNNMS